MARLARPVTWGSPHQPYGKTRAVTATDRSLIQSYRSGKNRPIFKTNFADAAEPQRDWNIVSDDIQWDDYQSCRRPENVQVSSADLKLKTLVGRIAITNGLPATFVSKANYSVGYLEATMKIAEIRGMKCVLDDYK